MLTLAWETSAEIAQIEEPFDPSDPQHVELVVLTVGLMIV
jgi:hypothetical protein